jgi:peptide/nickel transport system substrate-binding protein
MALIIDLQFYRIFVRQRIGPAITLLVICGILVGCGPSAGNRENSSRMAGANRAESPGGFPPPGSIDQAILTNRSFGEAPMLAERVAAGILPPVADRLPENPFVVVPFDRIGDYGGTLHRFIATEVIEEEGINKSLNDGLFRYENHLPGKIQPNLAESYEFSPDSRELTIWIRSGVKWSDGAPFTTADILFWYYDMTFDREARTQPLFPSIWLVGGKPVKMEAIDATTLRVSAEKPLARILNAFCHNRFAYPKHVLSRHHPQYNPEADYGKFREIASQARLVLQPDLPRLSAWVPVGWVSGQRVLYERNPYYWKVDTVGNQLPYADRLEFSVMEDRNVMLLKFLSGEVDFFGRYARPGNYFPLKKAEAAGKIRVGLMGPADIVCFYLNWDSPGRNQREAIRDIRVRQALSHAVDREEITEILYYGILLEPCGYSLNRGSPFFSEEAYRKFTEFDPARAKSLLDEAGYIDSDRDGWREFRDGTRFELILDYSSDDSGGANLAELIRGYWEAVGIKIHLNGGKSEIIYVRALNGDFEINLRAISAPSDPAQRPNFWAITSPRNPFWHRHASVEGPDWLREATELLEGVLSSVDEEQNRIKMEKFRDLHTDNIPAIGIGSQYRVWAASTRLGNVPFEIVYDNDYHGWGGSLQLPQIYIKKKAR